MCGWTCVGKPDCTARRLSRSRTWPAVMRRPRVPTSSAGSSRCASSSRSSSQSRKAFNAAAPTGTLRRLLPLPSTCAVASLASIQPAAPGCRSSPTSSPTRKPQPYSSSTMHRSRATRLGDTPSAGAASASAIA